MLELHHGALRLLVGADGSFTLRRGARELLRDGGIWSSAGAAHDRLVVLTEGVIAGEDAGPPSAPESVEIVACDERSAVLAVGLATGGARPRRPPPPPPPPRGPPLAGPPPAPPPPRPPPA